MDDESDMLTKKINDLSPQLNVKNQTKILAQIILLVEAQRQGIYDFPIISDNRKGA